MFTINAMLSSSHFFNPLKPLINPSKFLNTPLSHSQATSILKTLLISLTTHKPISILSQPQTPTTPKLQKTKNKKPLDALFKEALGFCERSNIMDIGSVKKGEGNVELIKKLWDLEIELWELKKNAKERNKVGTKKEEKVEVGSKSIMPKSLLAIFGVEKQKLIGKSEEVILEGVSRDIEKQNLIGKREDVILKEISRDMEMLLRHLYDLGYFKDANFLFGNEFEVGYFDNAYARDFVKFAVERFGADHQDIAKWLSGSDLKTLALFGCPSLKKREVFAAKRLRIFFEISEESVCSKCCLKDSCKFVNQSVWKGDNKKMRLDFLMRLLRTYSLEDIPRQLKLTEDLKSGVSRLMHEIINLSKRASSI